MNREIISEINRFREILSLPLLLEQFKLPTGLFDDLIEFVGKSADEDLLTFISKPTADLKSKSLLDELNNVYKKLNLKSVDELISKLEKKTLTDLESDEVGAALLRAGNKELQDVVYKAYLKTSQGVQVMNNTLNMTKTQDIINSGNQEAIEELRKVLKEPIEQSTELGDEVKRFYYDLIDKKLSKVKEDVVDPKEKLSTFAELGGALREGFWEIYRGMFSGEIENFASVFKRWLDVFMGTNTNLAKITILSREIDDGIKRASELGGTYTDPDKLRRLIELCAALKIKATEDLLEKIKQLYNEGKLTKPVYEALVTKNVTLDEWMDEMLNVAGVKKDANGKIINKTMPIATDAWERWKAFRKMLDPTYPWRKAAQTYKNNKTTYLGELGNQYLTQLGRVFWQVVWLDPRLPSEVLAFRNARGATIPALIASKVVSHITVGYGLIPFALAILNVIKNFYDSWVTEAITGEQEVYFGEADIKELKMEDWDLVDFWWEKVKKWQGLDISDYIMQQRGIEQEKDFKIAWEGGLLFWTGIDELIDMIVAITREPLSPEEKKRRADEIIKKVNKLEKQGEQKIKEAGKAAAEELAPVQEKLEAAVDSVQSAIETGNQKVQDFIDDNEEIIDDVKDKVTGEGGIGEDEASSLGISNSTYKKWVMGDRTLEKVSDNELNYKVGNAEYAIKKYDGKWYWDDGTTKTLFEGLKRKQKNMKTLNESIREKLTSKYIDKSKKFIKITENLEKVYPYFEEEKYDVFFKKMFKLAESYKKSKLYINEADEELFSKGLSLLSGQEDLIKEKLVSYISSALSLNSTMKNFVKAEVENIPNDQLGSLFTSPKKIAEMVADAVVDHARKSKTDATDLMSAIETSTIPYFETSEFRRKLVRELEQLIGPKMDDKKSEISNFMRKILMKAQED